MVWPPELHAAGMRAMQRVNGRNEMLRTTRLLPSTAVTENLWIGSRFRPSLSTASGPSATAHSRFSPEIQPHLGLVRSFKENSSFVSATSPSTGESRNRLRWRLATRLNASSRYPRHCLKSRKSAEMVGWLHPSCLDQKSRVGSLVATQRWRSTRTSTASQLAGRRITAFR